MKPPHSSPRPMLARATASLILLSVGYVLGFLSSTPYKPEVPPQPQPQPQPQSTPPPPHDLLQFPTQCGPPLSPSLVLPTLLQRLFNSTSPYLDFPSPATAALLLPPASRPRGWGSTNPVFAHLISTLQPRTIIELGTFLGASALHMARLTRHLNTTILCIDDFRGWPALHTRFHRDLPPPRHADALLLHQFMLTALAAGESDRLLPLPFSTTSALQALCQWGVYGDLVEVDAGHDFHSAWADINLAWAVVRPGGVLFGHDYHTAADNRGVRRAVTLFAKVKGLTVSPHGQHWVLSPKPQDDQTDHRTTDL